MRNNHIVKGGQGRSARDIHNSASSLLFFLTVAVALLAVLIALS